MTPGTPSRLATLRRILLLFLVPLVLFGIVLAFILTGAEQQATTIWVTLVVVVGVLGLVVVVRLRSRPLLTDSPGDLAQSYTTTFFLSIAFAETAALMGFVGAFISGHLWVYLLGFAFSAVGFALLAPTDVALARRDEQLAALGSAYSLRKALSDPATGTRPAP